jgi:hypothetical protein
MEESRPDSEGIQDVGSEHGAGVVRVIELRGETTLDHETIEVNGGVAVVVESHISGEGVRAFGGRKHLVAFHSLKTRPLRRLATIAIGICARADEVINVSRTTNPTASSPAGNCARSESVKQRTASTT